MDASAPSCHVVLSLMVEALMASPAVERKTNQDEGIHGDTSQRAEDPVRARVEAGIPPLLAVRARHDPGRARRGAGCRQPRVPGPAWLRVGLALAGRRRRG